MNNWNRLRDFYAANLPAILAEERCEWAIDPYAWDTGMLRMTPIEELLWGDIRECNAVFYPQFPVDGVFVDFANPKARVAIECDGHDYHLDKVKDRERDQRLAAIGWTVYRIPGWMCVIESDPDTGEASKALEFVRDIAERHRLSRRHTLRTTSGWVSLGKAPEHA